MAEQYDNEMRGTLDKNQDKDEQHPKWPDYKGKIQIDGKEYWLAGWKQTGPTGVFISLSARAADKQTKPAPKPAQDADDDFLEDDDDDIPF